MAEHDPDRAWDEYDWERFLQQQDQKTEKYMELLEKYIDDPDRDEIIAREMGWSHLLGEKDEEEAEAAASEDWKSDDQSSEEADAFLCETFEDHSLYRAAFGLTIWIDQLFDEKV